jgi:hypothetical protein
VQLVESLFQHKAKMISLLDPHTHTYKLASQADHVSDAEVSLALLKSCVHVVYLRSILFIPMIATADF